MNLIKVFDNECPNILIFDEIDSTSDEIKRIIKSGFAEAGLIVVADRQKAGYGKENRSWISESGNISFSFLLECDLPLSEVVKINFLIALTLREYLCELFPNTLKAEDVKIKWPNDILIKDKKIAGILCESEVIDEQRFVNCGVGLNVSSAPGNISHAACLNQFGHSVSDNLTFILNFLHKFEDIYVKWLASDKKSLLIEALNNHLAFKQSKLWLDSDGEKHYGLVEKVKEDGALIFKVDDRELVINSGDLYNFKYHLEEKKDNIFSLKTK